MTSADDAAYLAGLVREGDRARYYATLFAPAELREDLFGIYGFAAEIARVPVSVRQPALGEIRLQWWRDALDAAARGEPGGAPAARAIASAAARRALPIEPLKAMTEARSADLYSDPPPTLTDLEGELGETQSALFQLASLILGAEGPETADASGHAGIAYGLALNLANFALDRARGRARVPAELLTSQGIEPADLFVDPAPAELSRTVDKLREHASRHLREARDAVAQTPSIVRAAFLPLAIVEPLLRRVERAGPEILNRPVGLSDLEMLVRIGAARFRTRPRPARAS